VPEKRFKDIDKYVDERMVLGIRPENIQDADFVEDAPAEQSRKVHGGCGLSRWALRLTCTWRQGLHSFVARVNPRTAARDGEPHTVVLNMEGVPSLRCEDRKRLLVR